MKKNYISIFVVVAFLAVSVSSAAAEGISQLTNNFSDHQYPSSANGQIAWYAYDGSDYEIYYWDGSKVVQVTKNSQDDRNPSLSFKSGTVEIAWQRDNGGYDIWYWNGTSETQITNNGADNSWPSLHNGTIAWYGSDGNDYEIYFFDGSSVQQITNNAADDWQVSNYNGNLAWSQWDGQDYEIIYKVGNSTTTVTNNNQDDYEPSLYDGKIAWYANDGNDDEIYFWDGTPGANPFMVTNNTNQDWYPTLFKDTVAWTGWDGNDYEIYYWDGGSTTKVTNNNTADEYPSFHDGRVAYRGQDSSSNYVVFHTEAPEDPNVDCQVNISSYSTTTRGRPAVGEGVPFTIEAFSPCRGDLYYEFYYRAKYGTPDYETPGNPWVKIQPYSTSNSATYTFNEAGSYVTGIRVVLDPANEPADLTLLGSVVIVE